MKMVNEATVTAGLSEGLAFKRKNAQPKDGKDDGECERERIAAPQDSRELHRLEKQQKEA
jgi:hypothetical protein